MVVVAHGNDDFLLMDYDKLEFIEAIEELAAMAGLEIPYENALITAENLKLITKPNEISMN